jgi:hypothetical protein
VSRVDDNKKFTENENIDDLIKSMDNDYGLLNIIKSYEEYDDKSSSDNKNKNYNLNENLHSENSEDSEFKDKDNIMFSNHIIQSSFNKIQIFKKILLCQDKKILSKCFVKWKNILISKPKATPSEDLITSNLKNIKNFNSNRENEHLLKNRKIIEDFCNSNSSYVNDYLSSPSMNLKYNYELPLKTNKTSNYIDSEKLSNEKTITTELTKKFNFNNSARVLYMNSIFQQIMKNTFHNFILNCVYYINSKKSANSSLSLLYIFTQLALTKNKLHKGQNSFQMEEFKIILNESEKKITKYEACLNEKAQIIESRNDRIEQQIETIELLTEEINRLNEKIDKLEKKGKNLNVIHGKIKI